ncbi:MAG: hypothetical protein ABIU09_09170 [Pyrinomonadaceae bacterium]
MNTFKHILFTFAMVAGLSVAVAAQKDDPKKPPPKDPPPVVNPREKPPPRQNPPREGDKPKKPGMAQQIVQSKETVYIA